MDKYVINNERGCTVTIMVPWNCDNHCAFCVNKCEYNPGFNVEVSMAKILENIAVMHEITSTCDFVITGGEPFADCSRLVDIIEAIPEGHPIYINTTLPVLYKDDIFEFIRKCWYKISGINVSRHIWTPVDGANDKFIKKIGKYVSIRINSVVPHYITYSDKNEALFYDFLERYEGFNIQIRSDYRNIDTEDIADYETNSVYRFLEKCDVDCYDIHRETNRIGVKMEYCGYNFTWHLTCDYSKVETMEGLELVDIIINQKGELMDDWNGYGAPLDLEMYKGSVK